MKEAREFFSGSRFRFTVPGDRKSRFERRVIGVHEPRKADDPLRAIVLRVEKAIPAVITVWGEHYRPRRLDRVYFCPGGGFQSKRYFIITEDCCDVTFSAEAVGAYRPIFRDDLVRYGCIISGADVRRACADALLRNHKDLFRVPLGIANAVSKFGKELDEYARSLLAGHPDWFFPEELETVEQYLAARA